MTLSCPSKTFISGEYAVLNGGPAILMTTPPFFVLENNVFIDPHAGQGGFGASGAKFLLAERQQGQTDIWKIWQKYHSLGLSGSGADMVAQWHGGMTFFYPREKMIESFDPTVTTIFFQDILIILIRTGHKVLTHEHINMIKKKNSHELTVKTQLLENTVFSMYQAIKNRCLTSFINNINHYQTDLQKLKLSCENTQALLKKLRGFSHLLATKGCGALGADVILAVIQKVDKLAFLQFAQQEKLHIAYIHNQFSTGIQMT